MIDVISPPRVEITKISQQRLSRMRAEAKYWMARANKFYKEMRRPGYSRSIAARRLAEYFDEIERVLNAQPPR